MSILYLIGTIITAAVLVIVIYLLRGGKKLWGPERGVPFCGHPFEQTWGLEEVPEFWRCPKCGTGFVPDMETRTWVVKR